MPGGRARVRMKTMAGMVGRTLACPTASDQTVFSRVPAPRNCGLAARSRKALVRSERVGPHHVWIMNVGSPAVPLNRGNAGDRMGARSVPAPRMATA